MTEAKHKQRLFDLVFGQMAAQSVATAARLRVADALGDGDLSSAEIAAQLRTDAAATAQLCHALAALGVLTQATSGRFRLTETGSLLRTDRPDSLNSLAQMFTHRSIQAAWQELDTVVRTGESSFAAVNGKPFPQFIPGDPELSILFPSALRESAAQTAETLPGHYDFAAFDTVADISGGNGTVLAAILVANPGLRAILYDTAPAVSGSHDVLAAAGVTDRCTVLPGDLAAEAPAGADLYLVKNVLHYSDDDRAVTVLKNIRRVIPPHGRLLIVDPVLPETVDGSLPDTMYLSDLHMRIIGGGLGRTRPEFEKLCVSAGFAVTQFALLPAPMAFSLIEAAPGGQHG